MEKARLHSRVGMLCYKEVQAAMMTARRCWQTKISKSRKWMFIDKTAEISSINTHEVEQSSALGPNLSYRNRSPLAVFIIELMTWLPSNEFGLS